MIRSPLSPAPARLSRFALSRAVAVVLSEALYFAGRLRIGGTLRVLGTRRPRDRLDGHLATLPSCWLLALQVQERSEGLSVDNP